MTTPAGDDVAGSGRLIITLDSGDAVAEAQRLGDRIEGILTRAARDAGLRMQRSINTAIRRITPVRVRVEADLRAFGHSIDTLRNFDPVPLPVAPDVDRAQFEAAIQAALSGLEVSVRVVPDLSDFDAAIRAHNAPTVNVRVDADQASLGRLSGVLGKLGGALGSVGSLAGSALKIGAIGIAAASATTGVVGLIGALAPAAGLLAAGPAVILGYQAAIGALKLALSGVGDAFSAALTGDAEAFEKSLEGLSPKAQAAAREVRALKPAFDNLKSSVQDAFFEKIEGDITKTATALKGPLTAGLTEISKNWGKAAKGALGYIQSSNGVSNIKDILKATGTSIDGLSQTSNRLTAGFLQIGASVAKAFGPQLGNGLSNAGEKLGSFLQRSASSGQAVAWVDTALTVLAELGQVLQNLGIIIIGVFKAAQSVGGGFLANLRDITGQFATFVKSAEGQEAIGNIFKTLATVAAQLGPILGALVTQVGAIAPALGPLFTAIGPAIVSVISALGPAIQGLLPGVQALVTGLADGLDIIASSGALTTLGAALGQVGKAIAPLLPVLGSLIATLGIALAPVLSAVAAALAPVIQALSGALMPVLSILSAAFARVAAALTPLITLIGSVLAQAVTAAAPLLTTLATVFATLAEALVPIVAQITTAFAPALAQIGPLITQLVAALTPLINQLVAALLPALPPLIEAFLGIQLAVIAILPALIQLVAGLAPVVSLIISALAPVIQFAAEIIKWLSLAVVVPVINGIVAAIGGILSTVVSVATGVAGFVTSVVGFFTTLKDRVVSLVGNLVTFVVNYFTSLPGRARAAVSSIVGALSGVFNQATVAVVTRVGKLISDVVALVRSLPGKAKAGLGNIGSVLAGAGADMIRGFINGVKSQAGAIASAARDVVGNAVSAAKSLLKIGSPSKLFHQFGAWTGEGFVNGLTGTEADIKQAAEQIIGKIRDAFKGKNTRLDDTLIKSVQSTQARLLKLADQRAAIADKIKQANELAASVTQSALQSFGLSGAARDGGGVENVTAGLNAAVAKIRAFNNQINALAKRGLNRDLLSQLIGLGPDQGAALADQISKASSSQLADLNEAQKQLEEAAKDLGKTSADSLFDAGRNAGAGFLQGLKDQEAAIAKEMKKIANTLAGTIRKALGIRSPSRVLRKVGLQTMQGLRLGVDDQIPAVVRSAVRAVSALTDPFGPGVSAPRIGAGAAVPGFGVGSGSRAVAGGSTVNRTVAPVINLNGTGYSDADAHRLINRVVALSQGL